jgi:hypothetical protein
MTDGPAIGEKWTPEGEFRREYRLVDQAISMQARLRDWNLAAANLLTFTVIVASVVGVAFAFASNENELSLLGITAQRTTWLGWLAIVSLSVAIIDLVVDRRAAAGKRQEAVRLLSDLKAAYSSPVDADEASEHYADLRQRYGSVTNALPPVPEWVFNRLKSHHLKKVEVSKLLSECPGISTSAARRELRRRLKQQRDKATGANTGE